MSTGDPNRFRLEQLLLRFGALTAAEVRSHLEISAPTLSRLIAASGNQFVRLGQGRAVRYGLPRPLPEVPSQLPVFRVDQSGSPSLIARLIPLATGKTWLESEAGNGHLYAGLPPVVVDMSPAGYLGSRFAERHFELRLPPSLKDWSDDHRLVAVARRGEDLPGDLIIGEESMDRFLTATPREISESEYPAIVEQVAALGAGSSAAGEHPKFTAFRGGRHVLVKFTAGDGSPSDERWRDLLVCEAIALEALSKAGIPSAKARILDIGPRRYLEIERFDRIGARGRRGVLALGPLDDDLFGARDTWTDASRRLEDARLLSDADARRLRMLDAFGAAISNGDRHFGNVAFFADGLQAAPKLSLAPVYDMLPMDAAPNAGVLPALPATLPPPRAKYVEVWGEATRLGRQFWAQVAIDERVSDEFREAAKTLSQR